MPRLIKIKGSGPKKEYELGDATILGRGPSSDIVIHDPGVSRLHARIMKSYDGYVLQDLASANGTYIDGNRITRVTLDDGCKIRICGAIFRFEEDESAAAESASVEITGELESDSILETTVDAGEVSDRSFPIENVTDPKKLHQMLRILHEITEAISSMQDTRTLLEQTLEMLFDIFPQSGAAFIMLRDEETGALAPEIIREKDGAPSATLSISERCISLATEGLKSTLSTQVESSKDSKSGSKMCVPLGRFGLLNIDGRPGEDAFSQEDLVFLTLVANQAALAISNARMQKAMLEKERLDRDLRAAARVQANFLPQKAPEIEGYEFATWYDAALAVSGDFHDFIEVSKDRLGVVIGDVAGKGLSAALLMARLARDIRFFASSAGSPKNVLSRVNAALIRDSLEESFATLLYVCLDVKDRRLTLANAGHNLPLVRRGSGSRVEMIESYVNRPIGMFGDALFEQGEFQLERGDTVIVFTDGLTEARNDKGEQFGLDRLEESIKLGPSSPEALLQQILSDVSEFVGKAPRHDDLTILCFGPKEAE